MSICEPQDAFCLKSLLANCCCSYCFLQFWGGSLLQSSNVALRVMGCKGGTGNHWIPLCEENKGREERGRKLRNWRRPNFYEFVSCVIGHVQYNIWFCNRTCSICIQKAFGMSLRLIREQFYSHCSIPMRLQHVLISCIDMAIFSLILPGTMCLQSFPSFLEMMTLMLKPCKTEAVMCACPYRCKGRDMHKQPCCWENGESL